MVEAPSERCWHWLYHGEAGALVVGNGYESVPEERRPIVLAWIRFPTSGGMTIQAPSYRRATLAAKFFGPRLGSLAVAVRCRLINRVFASDDGAPDALFKMLDRNVTVIDPREAEARLERDLAGARSPEEAERAAVRSLERRLASGEDVPLVEDFPLAPEEETSEFQHLELALRFVRAMEHWRGNTHLTLAAIIVRLTKDGALGRPDVVT
jgi:hypothetical protein